MACNYSSALDPTAVTSYAIVDVDWSSGKEEWAKARPMNAEYVFDFRAANVSVHGQTFVSWFIEQYFFGSTALGNEAISGLYVDDFWSISGGPSEMDSHAVVDMGLSTADVAAMSVAYAWVLGQAALAVENRGKWTWSEFLNNDPCE